MLAEMLWDWMGYMRVMSGRELHCMGCLWDSIVVAFFWLVYFSAWLSR